MREPVAPALARIVEVEKVRAMLKGNPLCMARSMLRYAASPFAENKAARHHQPGFAAGLVASPWSNPTDGINRFANVRVAPLERCSAEKLQTIPVNDLIPGDIDSFKKIPAI